MEELLKSRNLWEYVGAAVVKSELLNTVLSDEKAVWQTVN